MTNPSSPIVLVTGATGSLGGAVAHAFATSGARVVMTGRSASPSDGIAELSDQHEYFGGVDVTDASAVAGLVEQVLSRYDRIDVLVNTVGGFKGGMPVHETPIEAWDQMMSLNAKSAFLMSRAVVPGMLEHGWGRIINIGSIVALSGGATMAAYTAAKSVVVSLTRSMAAELGGDGITVNCVLPGAINTPHNRAAMPKADTSDWVEPGALAEIIVFLASSAACDLNGVILPVSRTG